MKMSRALAVALIKAWKADVQIFRISDDLLEELRTHGFVGHARRVRTVVGEQSKQSSDFCWANRFESAAKWLQKNGLERKTGDKDLIAQMNATRTNTSRYKQKKAAVSELYASHRRSEQWGVCK